MKIWILAGEYPTPTHPGHGTFVRDQVEALRAAGNAVRVVHALPPTLRPLANAVRPRVAAAASGLRRRRASPVAASQSPIEVALPPDFVHVGLPTGPLEAGRPHDEPRRSSAEASRAEASQMRAVLGSIARGALDTGRVGHDAAGNGVAVARLVAAMRRLATADGPPDVVHAHNVFPAGVAAALWTGRRQTPYVVTEHISAYLRGQYSAVELATVIRVLDRAAAVVAVSRVQAQALPLPAARVVVVPNVVPTEEFALRNPSAWTSGTVLSIGTLTPHKRMDLLLRAYALLPAQVRARHPLRIVGTGPQRDGLAALARSLGLAPEVLTGRLSRAAVAREMAGAAVLVSASAVETFGVTMIEALAAGVPFVATDSGGPRDLGGPGLGQIVPYDDPALLAAAITGVLTSPATEAADAARRRAAQSRYGPAAVAASLERIYRSVAVEPPGRPGRGWGREPH